MAVDLTTILSVTLGVRRYVDQTTSTWNATMEAGATSTLAYADYFFQAGDTLTLGDYDVAVYGNLSGGGVVNFTALALIVVPPWRLTKSRVEGGRRQIPMNAANPELLRVKLLPC